MHFYILFVLSLWRPTFKGGSDSLLHWKKYLQAFMLLSDLVSHDLHELKPCRFVFVMVTCTTSNSFNSLFPPSKLSVFARCDFLSVGLFLNRAVNGLVFLQRAVFCVSFLSPSQRDKWTMTLHGVNTCKVWLQDLDVMDVSLNVKSEGCCCYCEWFICASCSKRECCLC